MKKVVVFLNILVAIFLVSCGGKSNPVPNAEKFLKGFFTYDYEAAKSVSNAETQKFINLIEQSQSTSDSIMLKEAKKINITIEKKGITYSGDTLAKVPFTLTHPNGINLTYFVNMHNVKNKWVASFTEMDYQGLLMEVFKNQQMDMNQDGPMESTEADSSMGAMPEESTPAKQEMNEKAVETEKATSTK